MFELNVLSADDWQLWRALRLRSLEDAPDAFGSSLAEWQGPQDIEESWRSRLEQPGSRYIVASDDSNSVGMAAGLLKDPQVADLIALWVDPNFRRQGIGELLVGEVQSWAREAGAKIVRLIVFDTNQAASPLFQRCGFTYSGASFAGKREMVMRVDIQEQSDAEEPRLPE